MFTGEMMLQPGVDFVIRWHCQVQIYKIVMSSANTDHHQWSKSSHMSCNTNNYSRRRVLFPWKQFNRYVNILDTCEHIYST